MTPRPYSEVAARFKASMRGRVYVPGVGPYDALVLWVGEAPGRTEEARREPFVGETGRIVRRALGSVGFDLVRNVRFNNALPFNVVIPPHEAGVRKLIDAHFDHLEDDLVRMRPAVIVACGGVALSRLRLNEAHGGITEEHGTVSVYEHPSWKVSGHRALLIPCLHPAGIMRGKIQSERLLIARVAARAAEYAIGLKRYAPPKVRIIHNPGVEWLSEWLTPVPSWIVVDTEFNPDLKRLDSIQLALNEYEAVVIDAFEPGVLRVIEDVLTRGDVLKVAHSHTADMEALNFVGIDVAGPWFDTMAASGVVYPDFKIGLSSMARFYCDNAWNWKARETMDLEYRALDVHFAVRVFTEVRADLTRAGLEEPYYDETMPVLPLLWGLTQRGMRVDPRVRASINVDLEREEKALRTVLVEKVKEMFSARSEPTRIVVMELRAKAEAIAVPDAPTCRIHPTYTGMRGKKFANNAACTCREVYASAAQARAERVPILKEVAKHQGRVTKWERRGFDPGNNHDLRWLLYDKAALALPVQRNEEGRPTANATAIAKLCAHPILVGRDDTRALLVDIKKYQHLKKMRTTFANPPVDERNVAHPPYRIATGTARVAGGEDGAADDTKGSSEYAFNVLNIPSRGDWDMRRLYVPHGGV